MILRIKVPNGQTIRVTLESNTRITGTVLKQILDQVIPSPKIRDEREWTLSKDESRKGVVIAFQPESVINAKTASSFGLKHGDILYLSGPFSSSAETEDVEMAASEETAGKGASVLAANVVEQDPVDDHLEKLDGLIERPKDSKFCTHGPKGMCDYCMPLEPYDSKYLEENKIKHLSFHAYVKSITRNNRNIREKSEKSSSQFYHFLEEPDYSVNPNCPNHPPYPQGICSKCQPSAITLQPQSFRMVDHIEFDNSGIVESFLAGWRSSGYQRFGYLYGYYRPYLNIPLGIKAVVVSIYEPPQDGSVDGLELLERGKEQAEAVDRMASALGLKRVGMIYTDLVDDGTGQGKVLCKRHPDSYFVSSLEAIFIARAQLAHPNACKYSSSGNFGSKFVTLVVSGDIDGNVAISEYQVSNVCMSLVRADIIEASTNPGLMRVQESTGTKYVPELFYKFKNKYNVNVQQAAAPTFPVDYLLVTLTHGFKGVNEAASESFFTPEPLLEPFPRFNRGSVGQLDPSMFDLKRKLEPLLQQQQLSTSLSESEVAMRLLRDFHVLVFIYTGDLLQPVEFEALANAVRDGKENPSLWRRFLDSTGWSRVKQVLANVSAAPKHNAGPSSGPWPCPHCTFLNESDPNNCEMCGLPKVGGH